MKSGKMMKSGMIVLCAALMASMLASCGGKQDESSAASGSIISEVVSTESASLDDSSIDISSNESVSDTTENTSVSTSDEAGEEVSGNVSEDVVLEAPSIEALEELKSEYNDKCSVILRCVTELDKDILAQFFGKEIDSEINGTFEAETEICFDFTGEEEKKAVITTYTAKFLGQEIPSVIKTVQIGTNLYTLDTKNKTYKVTSAPEINFVELFFNMTDVKSVETSTEEIDGTKYIVDHFIMDDGNEYYVYTCDGVLVYVTYPFEAPAGVLELKTTVTIGRDMPINAFEIPEDYTEVK